jgi:hypothetical protein
MPCKKSELITAMNSYVSARLSQDATLINMAASLLQNMVDSLDFSPEEETTEVPAEEEGGE